MLVPWTGLRAIMYGGDIFRVVAARSGLGPPHFRDFMVTLRHTTLGMDPLHECRRDLYLTTHDTHKRQTCVPRGEFEPEIPISERTQAHALDREGTPVIRKLIDRIFHYPPLSPDLW